GGVARAAGVWGKIGGVAMALGEKALGRGGEPSGWLGEAAVFGSALSAAACSVLYRPYVRRYPTVPVSAFAMLASIAFLSLLAARQGVFAGRPRFPAGRQAAARF